MNSELKPKIRFKGFTDDWEQRKFTDFVDFFKGQTYSPNDVRENGTLVLRSSNVQNGEVSRNDNVYISNKVVNVSNVKTGDVIVVVRNGSRALIGKHAKVKENMPNTVIGAFMTGIRSRNSEFINSLLNTSIFEQEIEKNMGATINQITGYMFANMDFKIPKDEEQKTIGILFDNIDNLITLHQRKCDKLVELKKSLLEKMLPQNNSVIPEIRFKGFTDDWEQRKLNDIYTFSQGMQVEIENQSLNKSVDMEQFIRIIDVTTNSEPPRYIYNTTGKGHVESNDIFFVRYGAVGTVGYGYTGTIANNLFKLSTNKKYCNDFMYQQFANGEFNKKLIEMSAFTSMPAINFSALNSLTFYETNLDEQNRIGKLFKSIDNLITLHQYKHEKLNKIKQSLLNDMFV